MAGELGVGLGARAFPVAAETQMSGSWCPGLLLVLEKAEGAGTGPASVSLVLAQKVKKCLRQHEVGAF